MRSLFVRIFTWLWLAIVLVAASAVITIVLVRPPLDPDSPRLRHIGGRMLIPQAHEAIRIYTQHGPEALADALDDWRIDYYLFDESGREITGREVSHAVDEFAREVARDDKPLSRHLDGQLRIAVPVLDKDHRKYVFVRTISTTPPGAPWPPRPMDVLLAEVDVLIIVIAAVFLISGVLSIALTQQLTKPLRTLRNATRQIADGDLSVRTADAILPRRDEFGDLSRDFDAMVGKIEHLLTVERQLLSDISHELRSPLARLYVALGIAAKRAGPDAVEALDRIEREAERLNDLIAKILTITRLESGTGETESNPIDLHTLVQECVDDCEFEANQHHRHVRLVACDACRTRGSAELLRSAIENVIRNAARYTGKNTAVEVSLRCTRNDRGATAVISVRDRGPGVPVDALAEIFRPFYRSSDARDRQTGGVGLGLAIAERAVRLHGGSVGAENHADGGLVVRISLPCAAPESAPS